MKLNPDESLVRLKACLVTKGCSQVYGMDYLDTSSVVKMMFVRICISLDATHPWPLYQLHVKNAFLNGILDKEVYMKQLPGFVARGSQRRCVG